MNVLQVIILTQRLEIGTTSPKPSILLLNVIDFRVSTENNISVFIGVYMVFENNFFYLASQDSCFDEDPAMYDFLFIHLKTKYNNHRFFEIKFDN